jgi:predicted small secreted protein
MKIFTVIMVAATLTACNTVSGIGKDIQTSSEWTKKQMEPKTDLNQK